MAIDILKNALPGYAKDLKLNLSGLRRNSPLTDQQLAGTMLASAIASRNPAVIRAIRDEVADDLTDEARDAAKAAAAIMGMNNVYYRFLHLVEKPDYAQMPAKLRMNVIAKPGVEKADFELWSLAVSAINGCGACVASHEDVVVKAGLSKEDVQDAVRVASVIHAVAVTLEAEEALADTPTAESEAA